MKLLHFITASRMLRFGGHEVAVNPDNVCYLEKADRHCTNVYLLDGAELLVEEEYESVVDKWEKALASTPQLVLGPNHEASVHQVGDTSITKVWPNPVALGTATIAEDPRLRAQAAKDPQQP